MTPIELRREIHRHPELSCEEHNTQRLIMEALQAEGISCRTIAGTGVLAIIEGERGNLRRGVVLRADIDALPIAELNDIDFRSENDGVMHACGHDMHAAVLFGVLQEFARNRDFEGTLFGIFQPGEELNPGGAIKVLEENPFEGYDVSAVIGEHTDSRLEVGEIGICPGRFMASNDELRSRRARCAQIRKAERKASRTRRNHQEAAGNYRLPQQGARKVQGPKARRLREQHGSVR